MKSNDIPKKAADFEAFLEESVCGKDKFSLCINAMTLLLKGGTDQRAILADMFGQHSNDDICNQFPEFEALRAVLQDGTVDELKKRCNTQLYGTRGRNGTKGLQDLLDEIPSRIDEVSRQRVDIDLADLELKKKALLDKLSENIKQQTDTQNSMKSYDKLSDGIIELKGQLSALQQKANEKLVCCIFQSAYVGEEQYHLIDAAAESGRPELMARFMAALGGNHFPRKKWEVPYQEFEELCAARSREAVSEQENTEKISDAEKTDMPQVASAERKKLSGGVIIAFAVLAMLCVGIFASLRWNSTVQSHDEPAPPTTNSTDLKTQNSGVNEEKVKKVDAQQTEKERYSGKLPVEGMPVRCLKYTTLGAPDKRLDCKNFDKLELGQNTLMSTGTMKTARSSPPVCVLSGKTTANLC